MSRSVKDYFQKTVPPSKSESFDDKPESRKRKSVDRGADPTQESKRQLALQKLRHNPASNFQRLILQRIPPCWRLALSPFFRSDTFSRLSTFLEAEIASGKKVFPPPESIFRAFELCPLSDTKVVILGQDPYHNVGQANGLAFSVGSGVKLPPSLVNIFKELSEEYKQSSTPFRVPLDGSLEKWAQQGVLLLNTCLTVRAHEAFSHKGKGWEELTDLAVSALNSRNNLVFMLWGKPAQEKGKKIDSKKHTILAAPHPSPLSAHRGFFGCGHFQTANVVLKKSGFKAIDWRL
uniref:Uracil-DNA glycosylase n=1 Tax=Palpitomonas bilix TaxID=652834 RepID=A0A7S3GF69_9EUKA|mmetsp:Transcript_46852/g.120726  ORF Transcript_46852/g.120726 Transcript_46852/m.120726 type:complete len:291 (+) Transcript_46852:116-988(+)